MEGSKFNFDTYGKSKTKVKAKINGKTLDQNFIVILILHLSPCPDAFANTLFTGLIEMFWTMSPKWDMENVKKSIVAKNNFRVGVLLCKSGTKIEKDLLLLLLKKKKFT